MQESGGGHNEFGHDRGMPFEGAGHVTEEKYAEYVAERDSFDPPRCQGVGPTQLTYIGYQNQADELGGCWKPSVNMLVGFGIIAGYRSSGLSWHECWKRYNGSESYAVEMDARQAEWKALLNP